jgi:hypothetical protein
MMRARVTNLAVNEGFLTLTSPAIGFFHYRWVLKEDQGDRILDRIDDLRHETDSRSFEIPSPNEIFWSQPMQPGIGKRVL